MEWRALPIFLAAIPFLLRGELLPIRAYTSADGLASDHVDGIVADSRGFLWLCTREGLTRFDGYRFISYGVDEGLAHAAVSAVLETRAGEYFVGTARGISRINASGRGPRFTTIQPDPAGPANYVQAMKQTRDGKIWVSTTKGLFEWNGSGKFRRQDLPLADVNNQVGDLEEDSEGDLWVGTTAGLFVVRDGKLVREFRQKDGLPGERVESLLFDSRGRLWVGLRGGVAMLRKLAAGGWEVARTFTLKNGLAGNVAAALVESSDGTLWVGTDWGISRITLRDGEPRLLQNLSREHGLTDRQINALAEDRAGNMWAGTEGAGVMRIARHGFTAYREQDGLTTDRVWSVFESRAGELMTVTVGGRGFRSVGIFDGSRFHAVVPQLFNGRGTWGWHRVLLQSRAGEWWIATAQGLCRLGAMKAADLDRKPAKACYSDGEIFRIFEDSKGGIWASAQSRRGDLLMRWDPETNRLFEFPAPRVPGERTNDLVSAFAEDRRGNIWMGLYKGGVYRYDGRSFRYFQKKDGVPGGTVFALLADDRGLWVGTNGGGLGHLEDNNSGFPRVEVLGTSRGLASNIIQSLVEDAQGRLYIGTGKGVDRLDPGTGHIRHFSTADGLAHGESTSAFRDRDGTLWFATKQGLSRLTTEAERPPVAPPVLITDLRVGGAAYPLSQLGETRLSQLELQPSQNQLQVEFVGIDYEPGDQLRYSYRLEGAGGEWSPPRSQHSVNYAALPGGKYRFLVKAVTSDGAESVAPAEVEFTVLPPVWRRWWFESLAAAAVMALVLAAHRYRVSQAVSLERMRTAIATDLHDDIGASLSQIAILSEVARMGGNGNGRPDEPLERVAALARELVDSMGDIVWSIRSEPHSMESLIRRMREFALDLLAAQGIEFVLRTPQKEEAELSLQVRRQLFLMFKECIHNAARHSGCTSVIAELKVADGEVALTVRDNGRGLKPDKPSNGGLGGTGIDGMRKRAEGLGGRLEMISKPGEGCTVEIVLPRRRGAFAAAGR